MPKGHYQREISPQKNKAIELLKEGRLKIREIAKETGYTTTSIRRFKKEIEETPTGLQTPEAEIEPITPAKPPKELIEAEGITLEPTPQIKAALQAKDIEGVFEGVNQLLPKDYQRTKEQISLLGKVWEAPLNRLMEKYVDENIDLYIAIIVTVLVFAPVPIKYLREKRKEKKQLVPKHLETNN